MKQLTIISVILMISLSSLAQKGKVTAALSLITQKEFEKAKAKLDEAVAHDKTKKWPKTYTAYGKFYFDLHSSDKKELKELHGDLLVKSYQNYQKATDLDSTKKLNYDQLALPIGNLYTALFGQGVEFYNAKNYEKAVETWEYTIKSRALSVLLKDDIDSSTMYNIGIAAMNGNMSDKALEYFGKAAELGYGGANVYILMKKTYLSMQDSTNALAVIQKGFEKHPEDQNILIELVNHYLTSGESKEALEYLDLAKQREPDNPSFYHAEGTLHDRVGDFDKAVKAYEMAIELKPDFFDSHYNLGVLYFNKAVKLAEEVNMDLSLSDAEFAKRKKEVDEVFGQAIPIFEKCLEIHPNDMNTMENLKILYYRLKMTDKHKEMKAKIDAMPAQE